MLSAVGKAKAREAMSFAEAHHAGEATRDDKTRWTTAAAMAWLWSRGARSLAREVGLHPVHGLTTPWDGLWRVDVAAVTSLSSARRGRHVAVHVVEVKGTRADLKREDHKRPVGVKKWQTPWHDMGVTAWLALGPGVVLGGTDIADWLGPWGILSVGVDGAVSVVKPAPVSRPPSDELVGAARLAIAEVLTAQTMPMMMHRDHGQRTAAIFGGKR